MVSRSTFMYAREGNGERHGSAGGGWPLTPAVAGQQSKAQQTLFWRPSPAGATQLCYTAV